MYVSPLIISSYQWEIYFQITGQCVLSGLVKASASYSISVGGLTLATGGTICMMVVLPPPIDCISYIFPTNFLLPNMLCSA